MASKNAQVDKGLQIQTHLAEYTKTFTEYDGTGRPTRIITARHDTLPGEIAVCSQYAYDGASSRVQMHLEYEILWLGAWDIITFPVDAINTGR